MAEKKGNAMKRNWHWRLWRHHARTADVRCGCNAVRNPAGLEYLGCVRLPKGYHRYGSPHETLILTPKPVQNLNNLV